MTCRWTKLRLASISPGLVTTSVHRGAYTAVPSKTHLLRKNPPRFGTAGGAKFRIRGTESTWTHIRIRIPSIWRPRQSSQGGYLLGTTVYGVGSNPAAANSSLPEPKQNGEPVFCFCFLWNKTEHGPGEGFVFVSKQKSENKPPKQKYRLFFVFVSCETKTN